MSIRSLYQGLTSTNSAHLYVGDVQVDVRLPRKPPVVIEEWTRWGAGISDDSDNSDSSDEDLDYSDEEEAAEARHNSKEANMPELKPWKTLLLLPEKSQGCSRSVSVSSKSRQFEGPLAMAATDRYAEDANEERDSRELTEPVRRLLDALDPMLP